MDEKLTCVISGSFKFKPEIDELYEELEDNGIKVLAPDKGWLYTSSHRAKILYPDGFRSLPSERGMSPAEVEYEFLRHLGNASLLYLFNEEGYIGNMAAFELGHAFSLNKPVYARQSIQAEQFAIENIALYLTLKDYVRAVHIPGIREDLLANT